MANKFQLNILNMAPYVATVEQQEQGVREPMPEAKAELMKWLSFPEPPAPADIVNSAKMLAYLCLQSGHTYAMIDGPAFLMPALEKELREYMIQVFYPFYNADGKYIGFVETLP